MEVLQFHPPYTSDLAPSDFLFVSRMKNCSSNTALTPKQRAAGGRHLMAEIAGGGIMTKEFRILSIAMISASICLVTM
ncbi:hypothetical protein TNCV_1204631 [Trichonephila clavipes]|nr:hypothetical protein TNCV_1204631 [Trichonephila clavipes]